MQKIRTLILAGLSALGCLPLGLHASDRSWPTPPPSNGAGQDPTDSALPADNQAPGQVASTAPTQAPAVIYNGPVTVNNGATAPSQDYSPVLLSRRPTPGPDQDPHQRGLKLGGPRFGVSYSNGPGFDDLVKEVHQTKPDATVNSMMTQFGWQMEYRMFRTDQGVTALTEVIPLVGGLDQGLALPSLTWLVGLRSADGFELGVGPDLGIGGVSMMIGAGYTVDMGGLNIPINLAVGEGAKNTTSTCLSVGFNL
jgi:hypothetical protein